MKNNPLKNSRVLIFMAISGAGEFNHSNSLKTETPLLGPVQFSIAQKVLLEK